MQCPRAAGQDGTSELRPPSNSTAQWADRCRSTGRAKAAVCANLVVGGKGFRVGLVALINMLTRGSTAQLNWGLWSLPAPLSLAFLRGAVRIQLQEAGENFIADSVGPAVPIGFFPSAPFLVVDLVIE